MSIALADAGGASVATAGDAGKGAFAYCSPQYRVLFGTGTSARLGEEAERLGIKRALVLTTSEQHDLGRRLGTCLGDRLAGLFAGARMHTPVEVTNDALRIADRLHRPTVHPERFVAEPLDQAERMGDEQNRLAAPLELGKFVETLMCEPFISDR